MIVPNAVLAVVTALALLAMPASSAAQQAAKVARVGYLSLLPATADSARFEAFREGLHALGYVEGQNVAIEARYADGRVEKLSDLAAELVRLNVDVILAAATIPVRAAQRATRSIPIVMAFSGDPVGEGFVASLARPGGNITGLSATAPEMAPKRLEYLKAIIPKLATVVHLTPPGTVRGLIAETESAGRTLGVHVSTVFVRTPGEVERAFATMPDAHVGGVIVNLLVQHPGQRIAELALKSNLPTVSASREFAEGGGLLTYGPDFRDLFRRSATYVDKILKGARPGDLPVEQPTKFELVINLKTARALGLTVPRSLLARADSVIQ